MNCIIVDDEPLAREEMKNLIEEISSIRIVGTFSNAISALECIKTNAVDLLFLDIEMPLSMALTLRSRFRTISW